MSRLVFTASALAAVFALVACSSSSDDSGTKKEVSPTEGSSGSSGSAGSSGNGSSGNGSSGTPGTSGTSGSGTSGTSGGATTDAGPDGPEANCVPKGYAGNDKKVGAYCDKDVSCPFQLDPFLVCTYGHDPTNTHLFCTAPCSKDSECGTGAYCMHDPAGSGCVPTQCGGAPGM